MRKRLLRIAGAGVAVAALAGTPNFAQVTTEQVCTSSSQCPPGQLCCYPCGVDGCQFVCTHPLRGHCPIIP